MFEKFIETITTAFISHGSIEAHKDERSIVAFILAQLATLIQGADQPTNPNGEPVSSTDTAIATQREVEDIHTVVTALEAEATAQDKLLKDIVAHLVHSLNYIVDLKTVSHVE